MFRNGVDIDLSKPLVNEDNESGKDLELIRDFMLDTDETLRLLNICESSNKQMR